MGVIFVINRDFPLQVALSFDEASDMRRKGELSPAGIDRGYSRRDDNCARLGLRPRRDVRHVAEYLARRVDHHRPGVDGDPRGQAPACRPPRSCGLARRARAEWQAPHGPHARHRSPGPQG
jgi:hypothetical protein